MPKRSTKKDIDLQEQAEKIKKRAQEAGLEDNFFFLTTFDRYLQQLAILEDLKATINENKSLITQTYVKGRSNTVLNPAIRAYNSTTDSANKTVNTLIKILNGFNESSEDEDDALAKIINGG